MAKCPLRRVILWYNMGMDLVEKAISEGHAIAEKIRKAGTVGEVDGLTDEIERYSDFIDEKFGEPSELDGEMESSLSMSLYVALDWKRTSLYPENKGNEATEGLAADYLEKFINELDAIKNAE